MTGLPISAEALDRRVVAVKIDNAPGARPQSGLSQADIVYEHETEGSVTRYTAFFLDSEVDLVGPIRSSRFVDRDLVQQFDALFAHVGASQPVMQDLRASAAADMDQFYFAGDRPYTRLTSRPSPFNVYASLASLRDFGARRYSTRRWIEGLEFTEDPQGLGAVRSITIPPGPQTYFQVHYSYDPAIGQWRRSLAGAPDIDAANDAPITVANVVIQHVDIRVTAFIEDSLGNLSLAIPTTGSGPVTVFRDGLRVQGTWERPNAKAITRFKTARGTPLELRPGHTWVHLLDVDQPVDSG